MINKTYKIIHNKYLALFKFIFFLRYLFGIFFIAVLLFLLIPYLLDFKKKERIIKNHLLQKYEIRLNKYEDIEYRFLPIPNFEIKNTDMSIKKDLLKIKVASLRIYPKLINIYNNKNFETKKIIFNNSQILLQDYDIKILINFIYGLKNKVKFKKLDLIINRKFDTLISLKKINFSNFGYNKNIIKGEVFNKKFKISVSDDYNKARFKLFKTGISADIAFDEIKKNNIINGILKSKLLNSNLKFNFNFDDKNLKIYNSYFRNKDLSFKNEHILTYQPFFFLESIFELEDININFLKKVKISKIFNSKDLIKRINAKYKIYYKPKKFSNNLIDDLNLNIDLAYGRLIYSKKIYISNNFLTCKGDINLLKDNPILYFDCSIVSSDKKKFLKEFSINYKNKNELFKLKVKGNVNIFKNKINFKNIILNKDYKASKEDLNYFKLSFERILFDNDFKSIFNLKKIKEFILEIS
jgi:hypothetical protein